VIGIGPFTSRVEAVAAEKAFATGDRKGHNHAIPDLKVFTSEPTLTTSPIFSWPRISPLGPWKAAR
jgi:hypothetical protein